MKFGQNCEGFVGFSWFGMVWQRLYNPTQSVSNEKVGIELLSNGHLLINVNHKVLNGKMWLPSGSSV